MINEYQLSESSIKVALENGYITKKEARHMLKVYLKKEHFLPFLAKDKKVEQMA